jgi:hypothetical protein
MYPMTKPVCKPLLPIYDKPNIYYSLSTLLMAQIKDVLVIVPVGEIKTFENLLGDGSQFGIAISYLEQPVQRGIADAFIIGRDFIGDDPVCLILGDNIFYGAGFGIDLERARSLSRGAVIFGCYVEDPRPFGVVEFDGGGPGAVSGGKAPEAQVPLHRARPVLLRQQRGGYRGPDKPLRPGRAGDHGREPGVSAAGNAQLCAAGQGIPLVRHRQRGEHVPRLGGHTPHPV